MRFNKKKITDFFINSTILAITAGLCLLAIIFFTQSPLQRLEHPEYADLRRYTPNVTVTQTTYGDLAGMSGKPEHRVIRQATYWTDEYGFMNNPEIVNNDSCTCILALGDSFTASSPISQEKMWPSQLANLTGKSVYNLGHPAQGPWHQLMNYKIEKPRFKLCRDATIIWALFAGNDLDDKYGELVPKLRDPNSRPGFIKRLKRKFKTSLPGQLYQAYMIKVLSEGKVTEIITPDKKSIFFLNHYIKSASKSKEEIHAMPGYSRMVDVIKNMKDLCDADSVNLKIVTIPAKGDIYPWLLGEDIAKRIEENHLSFANAVMQICDELNIDYFNLSSALYQEAKPYYYDHKKLFYWEDDTHFNEDGHAFSAEKINARFFKPAELTEQ